ncbi:metallophosphoesterase [Candidatus Electronema sp. PJ]|uniref:metallophosphoesterase n=1 Tax=Candidatus Electronema sp. PJ TaxID=3401572 RepID=UPI003AA9B499
MLTNLYVLRFFVMLLLILAFMHFYLWKRLVKDPGLLGKQKKIGTGLIIVLFFLPWLAKFLARELAFSQIFPLLWLAYLWLGLITLFFFLFLFTDCLKILCFLLRCLLPGQRKRVNPAQKQRQARAFALFSVLLVGGLAGVGIKQAAKQPVVQRFPVKLANLPAAFQGFKIVQISDIHMGELTSVHKLAKIVQQVNLLQPDLVAITGDLVDNKSKLLPDGLAPLRQLKAKEGVFFVTGNHEYYSGIEDWLPEIEKQGVRILRNERIELQRGTETLVIAGVNDHRAGRFGKKEAPDYAKALGGLVNKKIILLAHQPLAIKEVAPYGVDLMISGHTHGGQIWPFSYLVHLKQPYLKGFYQEQNTLLFVSQGTACWGPPLRIGTQNEIIELTLQ